MRQARQVDHVMVELSMVGTDNVDKYDDEAYRWKLQD